MDIEILKMEIWTMINLSHLTIKLGSSSAYGTACHGMFTVESPDPFTWEDGRKFAEKEIDSEIYRYNLLLKAQAKKLGSSSGLHYQWSREGPIKKVLKGPCMEPTEFPPSKWSQNLWFCNYRYKAFQGTSEDYIKSMWWSKPGKAMSKAEMQKMDFGDQQDEPLY